MIFAVFVLTASLAQQAPTASRSVESSSSVRIIDRNSDGQISRDEFRGADRVFNAFDLNGDGHLSRSELAQATVDQTPADIDRQRGPGRSARLRPAQ
jgi:hypothetical protein